MAARKKAAQQKAPESFEDGIQDPEENEPNGAEGPDDDEDFLEAPPEGFVRRNANDATGWVAKEKGNVVYGMLLGRFARSEANEEGKVQHFYQVKVLQPCKVALPVDDRTADEQTRMVKRGEVVNLDENKGVEGLAEALKEGGHQFCWVKYIGKKAQQKNRSRKFWEIECHTQKRNAPF